jgi:hypothetical protein
LPKLKKFFVGFSVVLMLSIFFATNILLFSQLTFAQEYCVGNPDPRVGWKECIVKKDGSFQITEPRYGTEKDGYLPLHGIFSMDGGLDLTTPHGFCGILKRKLVRADQRWNEKATPTQSVNRDGTNRGPFNANFYYQSVTCKL